MKVVWVVKSIVRKDVKLVRTYLDIPLAIFLLVVFVSCLLTLVKVNHLFSSFLAGNLKETLQKIMALDRSTNIANLYTLRYTLTIFEGVLCYFLLTNNLQSTDSIVKTVTIIFISSAVLAGYGIFQLSVGLSVLFLRPFGIFAVLTFLAVCFFGFSWVSFRVRKKVDNTTPR